MATLAMLLAAQPADAQLAICSRVTPPPSYCTETEPDLPPPTVPRAAGDFVATGSSSDTISLAWTDNSDQETGYWLYRMVDGKPTYVATLAHASGAGSRMTYTVNGLASSQSHTFRIDVFNSAGTTVGPSVTASTTAPPPPAPPPPPPSPVAAVLTTDAITTRSVALRWTRATDATAYAVERRHTAYGGGFAEVARLSSSARSHVDGGLAPSTGYEYRIRAVDAPERAQLSNVKAAQTLGPQVARVRLFGYSTDPFEFRASTVATPPEAQIMSVRNVAVDELGTGLTLNDVRHGVTGGPMPYGSVTSAFNGQSPAGQWNARVGYTNAVFLWDCPAFSAPPHCSSRASIVLEVTWA